MWTEIATHISKVTDEPFDIKNRRSVGGGCINQGYAVSADASTYFVKLNQATQVEMFEAEALGLQQMLDTQTIRVPKPLCVGTAGDSASRDSVQRGSHPRAYPGDHRALEVLRGGHR